MCLTFTRTFPLVLTLSHIQYPCVILTAKGQSDLASRLFLRKIKQTLNLPVLGLFDCDPAGLKVSGGGGCPRADFP